MTEREQRYAKAFRDPGAFVERRWVEDVYPCTIRTARETLGEWQVRAVMAVADGEQEARSDSLREHYAAQLAKLFRRAEAAEAKLARAEALAEELVGLGLLRSYECTITASVAKRFLAVLKD